MNKFFFIVVTVTIGYFFYYLYFGLKILNSFSNKILCSAIFLSNRNISSILSNELNSYRYIISINVDYDQKITYINSIIDGFGLVTSKAVYRKGYGCTLIPNGKDIDDEKRFWKYELDEELDYKKVINDEWPYGDMVYNDNKRKNEKLDMIVENGFNDEKRYGNVNGTRAVIIVNDGKIVSEKYSDGFDKFTRLTSWSLSKSVLNALIGIMIKKGKIKSVYDQIPIKEWRNDKRKDITYDNLLRMNSGLKFSEEYMRVSDVTKMLFLENSIGEYAIKQKLGYEIEENYSYSSGTSNIVSYMIKRLLGEEEYMKFPRNELFNKLGMRSVIMETDSTNTFVISSYLFATARDWARFALLYLNKGIWKGEMLFPSNWIEYTTNLTTCSDGKYGAHFYLNKGKDEFSELKEQIYYSKGFRGQRIFYVPSKKLIVVRLAFDNSESNPFNFKNFLKDILQLF